MTSSSSLPPLPPRPERGDGLPPLPPRPQAPVGGLPPLRPDAAPPPPVADLGRERAARRPRRTGAVALGAVALVAAGAVGGVTATRVFPADTPSTAATPATATTTTATPASDPPASTTTVTAGASLEDAIAQVAPSVVTIRTGSGMGSGVVLAPRGLIITNEHVVDGADVVQIVTSDGRRQVGRVVRHDPAGPRGHPADVHGAAGRAVGGRLQQPAAGR